MPKKTETRPTTAHINPFGLRMQADLRERLEAAATEEGRSLNAEIVSRLEESFRRSVDDDKVIEVVSSLRDALEHAKADAEIAKAGALTSSKVVVKLLKQAFGDHLPPELERLRNASAKVAAAYESAIADSSDEVLRKAAGLAPKATPTTPRQIRRNRKTDR